MTLNPSGAPACIRCNTPLPPATRPDPGPPAQSAAPLPAAPAATVAPATATATPPAPATARAAAVVVEAGTGSPSPSEPSVLAQQRIRRRITVAGLVLVLIVLVVGGAGVWLARPHYLDTGAVANRLSSELSSRLGDRIRVQCTGTPRRQAGATFQCVALTSRGSRQTVTVTVTDDTGRYRWRLAGPL